MTTDTALPLTETSDTGTGRTVDASASGFRPIVASIGLLIVALGVSGLVDDTDLAPHPWWIAPLGAAAMVALMVASRSLAALRTG